MEALVTEGSGGGNNGVMRGNSGHRRGHASQRLWLEQRVQLSRGQWRREEAGGAIRSAGWWEAVTVTWSPATAAGRRPSLWHRALAAAVDTIAPSVAELMAASARHLLERQRGTRVIVRSSRRQLPTTARALPRPGKLP
jgi:hypothetical protein